MSPFFALLRQPTFVVGREDVDLDSVTRILAQHGDHHDQHINWPDLWFGSSAAHLYSVNRNSRLTNWNDFLHAVQRVQDDPTVLADGEVSALWRVAKQHPDLINFHVYLYSVQPIGDDDDDDVDRAMPVSDSDVEDAGLLS